MASPVYRLCFLSDCSSGEVDKAISLDDNFFPAHNNQGNVLQELREFDAANISYKKAIKINPHKITNPEITVNII